MARQQKLIHLHTSGTTDSPSVLLSGGASELAFGEIAVQYNTAQPKIYIRKANDTLAEFIDSEKVAALISNAGTSLQQSIDNVAGDLADELSARTEADSALNTRLQVVEAAVGAGQEGDNSLTSRVATLESGLETETSERTSADTAINTVINSLGTRTETLEGKLSGITNSDLTNAISEAGSALQSVSANNTSGAYAAVSVSDKGQGTTQSVGVTLTTKAVASATANDNGLAVAKDVKDYVDGQISSVTTTTNSIERDIDDLQGILSGLSNSDLTTTQSKAASALQAVCAGTSSDYATVSVSAPSENKQNIGVTLTTKAVASATTNDNGLAVAKDVKDYADGLNTAMNTRVTSLETFRTNTEALTAGEWGNQTIKQYIDSVSQTATNALKKITAGAAHDYVTVTVGNVDSNQEQTVEVAVTVQDVSSATAAKQGLADAYSAKSYADSLNTAMDSRVVSLETDRTKLMARTSGFSDTAGSIKDYIDNKVSSEIASVYKVKGSVATYADLPGENLTVGDVYNVIAASTVGTNVYPAGTNFVYTSTGWDALGGTVDLSPYMLESTFNTYTSTTLTNRLNNIETNITTGDDKVKAIIGGSYTSASTVADAISALESGSTTINNSLTAETKARQDADADINARIGSGFTSATTGTVAARMAAVESLADSNETNIGTINDKLGTGVTTANTVTTQLAGIKSTADSAVQTVVVANTATNGITASKSGTEVTLNFDNMVIDCGTY